MKHRHLLSFFLVLTVCTLAAAQQAVPVTQYGNGGTFMRVVNNDYADARQAIVQPDGKLLFSLTSNDAFSYGTSQLLYRINKNGTPDEHFGGTKKGIIQIGRPDNLYARVYGGFFDLQTDGKIVTANVNLSRNDPGPYPRFVIERFLPDGTRDSSFAYNGSNTFTYQRSYLGVRGIKIRPNNKILVLGTVNSVSVLMQFKDNGYVDRSFGDSGVYHSQLPYEQNIQQLLIMPDNKFIIAGIYSREDNSFGTCIIMHNPDGSIDSTFGTNGVSFLNNHTYSETTGLALQKGKLLVYTTDDIKNTETNTLFRLNNDGTLDNSFGNNGQVATGAFPSYWEFHVPREVRVQENGRIVVNNPQRLRRYYANGSIDSTFGIKGILSQKNTNVSFIFALTDTRLYGIGTDNRYHVMVNAYKFCNSCTVTESAEPLITRLKAAETGTRTIKLYPNPVKDKLTITGLNIGTTNLQLTDASGRVVKRAITSGSTYQWNVQTLPQGIYYLRVLADKAAPLSFKVMKE